MCRENGHGEGRSKPSFIHAACSFHLRDNMESEGIRKIVAVAVVTDVPDAVSPCGICRQFLREFCSLKMPVLMVPANYDAKNPEGVDGKGVIKEVTFEYLLPLSFGPEDLDRPRIPAE